MEELKFCTDPFSLANGRASLINSPQKANDMFSKGLSNLPKLFNSKPIDIYSLFALYSASRSFNVNIPTTIIKTEDLEHTVMLRTKTNGILHCRPCGINDFFALSQKNKKHEAQIYLYKSLYRESIVFHSKESAEAFWKSSKDSSAIVQYYVKCMSSQVSLTRVLWRSGKTKYFNIISCEKPIIRSQDFQKRTTCPSSSFKRKKTQSIDFRYTNLILKTSMSINNPYKINAASKSSLKERPKLTNSFSEANMDDPSFMIRKTRSDDPSIFAFKAKQNQKYILNKNNPESFIVVENKNKIPEIEAMISEIIDFLNAYIFKEEDLKGAIFEFVYDRDSKWVFLNCKEISLNSKLPPEVDNLKRYEANTQKRRSKSFVMLKSYENKTDSPMCSDADSKQAAITTEEQVKCPFRIRTSPKHHHAQGHRSEKELLERCNKVNEKIDQIVNLNPLNYLRDVDFKEQSIKAYQARFQLESYSFFASQNKEEGSVRTTEASSPSKIENWSPAKTEPITNAVFTDKMLDHTRKFISEGINHLDEMRMNTELLKIKRHNIVGKYGGDEFWSMFIDSLYQKILSFESLKAYFKTSCVKMIADGMFKIFNGCATLEFRRNVRSAHNSLGISESNFSLYIKLFEDTLIEFNVEEEDKQMIMSQIKSMKCLICRQTVL
ncbi:unnamed protein product [Blepharisma stoltei]|uniref:Uncharacterized protein n=1 Tax=Blepharisma stoltei TaxID=1481888 RepID=A0AAU9JC43_9CILI|nr:unnamed protein product [Blepharisma stoltei]